MRGLINRTTVVTLLVFVAALLPRLYKLGSFLTIDEVKWAEGAAQFLIGLHSGNLFHTYWHFFPGITITWGGSLVLWGLCAPAPDLAACANGWVENLAEAIGWLRLSPVLLTSLGVAGVYVLGRRLLGDKLALLTTLLLAFDPFFLAHSRILNGDAAVAILMFLSVLAFLIYWRGESPLTESEEQRQSDYRSSFITLRGHLPFARWLILSGVFAGLALLTKLPAPVIVVFVVGLGLLAMTFDWRRAGFPAVRRWMIALTLWGGVALLTFVILWPAMWTNPSETLRLMYIDAFEVGGAGEGHATFFLGQTSSDPGPWFYPYVIAFRLTPVVMIGLVFVLGRLVFGAVRGQVAGGRVQVAGDRGQVAGRWQVAGRRSQVAGDRGQVAGGRLSGAQGVATVLVMLAYIIVVILFANVSPKKLDRYVMAVIPALVLLAAIGLDEGVGLAYHLWRKAITARNTQYKVANGFYLPVLTVLVALQLLFAILATPYYLTYYNPLLGGVSRIVARAPVGWGEGLEQAALYLNGLPNAEALKVSSWYGDIFQPYFVGQWASFADDGRAQLAADYVVFYVNQIQRQKPYPGLVDYFRTGEPEFVVAVEPGGQVVNLPAGSNAGEAVAWVEVYKAPAAQSAGGAPKIEGVARLLAYKVVGVRVANGSDTSNVPDLVSDEEVAVTLYLRVLGDLSAGTNFNVGLVQNSKWGSLKKVDIKGDCQVGKIVEWRGLLTLPPQMPAGNYRLWAALEAEDGPIISEFSISDNDPMIVIGE